MDEMGLGNGQLPDSALSASSVLMPSPLYGPARARLHGLTGWRPAHDNMHEYLMVITRTIQIKQKTWLFILH